MREIKLKICRFDLAIFLEYTHVCGQMADSAELPCPEFILMVQARLKKHMCNVFPDTSVVSK